MVTVAEVLPMMAPKLAVSPDLDGVRPLSQLAPLDVSQAPLPATFQLATVAAAGVTPGLAMPSPLTPPKTTPSMPSAVPPLTLSEPPVTLDVPPAAAGSPDTACPRAAGAASAKAWARTATSSASDRVCLTAFLICCIFDVSQSAGWAVN